MLAIKILQDLNMPTETGIYLPNFSAILTWYLVAFPVAVLQDNKKPSGKMAVNWHTFFCIGNSPVSTTGAPSVNKDLLNQHWVEYKVITSIVFYHNYSLITYLQTLRSCNQVYVLLAAHSSHVASEPTWQLYGSLYPMYGILNKHGLAIPIFPLIFFLVLPWNIDLAFIKQIASLGFIF